MNASNLLQHLLLLDCNVAGLPLPGCWAARLYNYSSILDQVSYELWHSQWTTEFWGEIFQLGRCGRHGIFNGWMKDGLWSRSSNIFGYTVVESYDFEEYSSVFEAQLLGGTIKVTFVRIPGHRDVEWNKRADARAEGRSAWGYKGWNLFAQLFIPYSEGLPSH